MTQVNRHFAFGMQIRSELVLPKLSITQEEGSVDPCFEIKRSDQGEKNETKPTHHHLPRRRRSAAPPSTAALEEKPLPEYLSILSCSDCREAGAIRASGGSQMKTITIRLPDVEAAMLVEVQKVNRAYRDLQGLLVSQIQQEYAKTPKGRASR
jgi:hypothetical protein